MAKRGRPKGSGNKNSIPAPVPMPVGKTYTEAWTQYKLTDEYRRSVATLTNRTYAPTQPYVDHVIERIFLEGYHSHRQQTQDNGTKTKPEGVPG